MLLRPWCFCLVFVPYFFFRKIAFKDYDHHQEKGGLASMGETLKRGMVLSVSIWDDYATHMAWLDAQFPPGEDPDERPPAGGVLLGPIFWCPIFLIQDH